MNLANKFSLIRLLLTPVFVLAILYYREDHLLFANLPLIVFLTAVITDAIDGFIARRYKQITHLGTALDPLADKFLLAVAFITLTFTKTVPLHLRIPPWVLIIVLTRDIFIIIGASIIYLLFEYIEFRPSILGKIVTFFQMVTVISVLLRFEYSYIIWTTTAIFTVLSGVHYLIRTNRIISEKAKRIV
jgi:CDP-diacylglycerol--glycerol-3-phosphate 3-phosphatidyltransferase